MLIMSLVRAREEGAESCNRGRFLAIPRTWSDTGVLLPLVSSLSTWTVLCASIWPPDMSPFQTSSRHCARCREEAALESGILEHRQPRPDAFVITDQSQNNS
jgi:hypothetical protein